MVVLVTRFNLALGVGAKGCNCYAAGAQGVVASRVARRFLLSLSRFHATAGRELLCSALFFLRLISFRISH